MFNLIFIKGDEEYHIKIELFNNKFVNKFTSLLSSNISKKCSVTSIIFPQESFPWDQSKIDVLAENLRSSITRAVDLVKVEYPIPVNNIKFLNKSSEERNLLNFIHRTFTNFYKSNWSSWEGTNKLRKDILDTDLVVEALQAINENVHNLEPYFYHNNPRYSNFQHSELEFKFDDTAYFEIDKSDFQFKSKDAKADIWLPISCMLGKNLFSAYLDYDDPTKFDIVNENLYNGDFTFSNRNTLINDDVKNWALSNGAEVFYGLPLGNIVQGKSTMEDILDKHNAYYSGKVNPYKLVKLFLD